LKRVHAVGIASLDTKTLPYQRNTGTSVQKPGKSGHAVKCAFFISKRQRVQLKGIYITQPFDNQSSKLVFLAGRGCMVVLSA